MAKSEPLSRESSKGGTGPEALPKLTQKSLGLETVEGGGKGVLADRIVDDVATLALRDLADAGGEILASVVDDMRRTGFARERAFLVGAHRADQRRAERTCPLAGDEADAARSRVKEHHRFGAHAKGLAKEVANRHAPQHDRRRGLVADLSRQLDETVGRDEALLRVAAEDAGIGDPVADLDIDHVLADREHFPCPFRADHGRKRWQRVESRAVVDVDEIHADGALADQRLAGAGRADVDRLPDERLGTTGSVKADRMSQGRALLATLLRGTRVAARSRLDPATPAFYWLDGRITRAR